MLTSPLNLLNPSVYLAINGRDYRTPAKLDLDAVTKYFQGIGFDVKGIGQKYRHAHGRLQKGNDTYFFKLASTETISECTYNEMVWDKHVSKGLKDEKRQPIIIPKIYDQGYWKDRFYFIAEYFDGPTICDKQDPLNCSSGLDVWQDKIIEASLFLSRLEIARLPRDLVELSGVEDYGKCFFQRDAALLKDLGEFNLFQLLEEVRKLNIGCASGIVHGDFVPWHMITKGESFVLVDAELGSAKFPRYYDIAYFFTRTYIAAQCPGKATEFVNKFRDGLLKDEKCIFDCSIYSLVSSCVLWNFWRDKNYGKDDFVLHLKLKNEILGKKIFC